MHNDRVEEAIKGCDGYLVPGGFGERGWTGKIMTAKYCRENKIPYFGICLGMQVMAVEFARHVAGLEDANSTEIDAYTKHPVISLLSEQRNVQDLGGTMRLGAYTCNLKRELKPMQPMVKAALAKGIATVMNLTINIASKWKPKALSFQAILKGGHYAKFLKSKTILGW